MIEQEVVVGELAIVDHHLDEVLLDLWLVLHPKYLCDVEVLGELPHELVGEDLCIAVGRRISLLQ